MCSDTDAEDLAKEIKGKIILHWNYRGLTELPIVLRNCANDVREIYLKDNKLTNFPQWINELVNVTHLYLHGNNLKKVPEELTTMSHLVLLDLSDNGLENVSSCIGELKNLEVFNLDHNSLKKLPLGEFFMGRAFFVFGQLYENTIVFFVLC